jgi:hypothetical protein
MALLRLVLAGSLVAIEAPPAEAQRIDNQIAVFAALDKVTAKIQRLEVPLGTTAKFGSLKLTPRTCYTRPPIETPKTTSFVEIDEVMLDGKERRVFAGWMFAQSPGLNPLEHPVFDVWLTGCAQPPAAAKGPVASAPGDPKGDAPPPAPPPKRRPKR